MPTWRAGKCVLLWTSLVQFVKVYDLVALQVGMCRLLQLMRSMAPGKLWA